MPSRAPSRRCRFTPDLLDDEDALAEAVAEFLAAHVAQDGSTHQLAQIELGAVHHRLAPYGREVLNHALDLIGRAHEEAAIALAARVLRDVRRPRLDQVVLADPDQLGIAIDTLLQADPEVHPFNRRVRDRAARVRSHVDDTTWRLCLQWETALGDRNVAAQDAILKWAFSEGARSAGQHR